MRAAFIEATGPPESIRVDELPRPPIGPARGARQGRRGGPQPDRPVHPVGSGRDAAVVPVHHRLRPGRDGRGARPGRDAVPGRRSGLGLEPGAAGPPGRDRRVRGGRRGLALPHARAARRCRGRGHGPGRDHGAPRACSSSAGSGRARRSTSPAAAAASARWSSRWPRPPGPAWRPRPAAPSELALCRELGADLALNYKTDDIPARLREFAPDGIDVWYETQREPNLEVSIPLLRSGAG